MRILVRCIKMAYKESFVQKLVRSLAVVEQIRLVVVELLDEKMFVR
jgi:hypothetical protein